MEPLKPPNRAMGIDFIGIMVFAHQGLLPYIPLLIAAIALLITAVANAFYYSSV